MDPIHAALLQYLTRLPWQWPVDVDEVSDEGEEPL